MPREQVEERLVNGLRTGRSANTSGPASDEPGAVPQIQGEPTADDLPTSNGSKTALIFVDVTVNSLKIALPDVNNTVVTKTVLDLSGVL